MRKIRILTLNLHKGIDPSGRRSTLLALRNAIEAVNADLIFLQEVVGDTRSRISSMEMLPQHRFLAAGGWPYSIYGANADAGVNGHHGNALLSRLPIVSWKNIDISLAGVERRGLLHAILQLPEAGTELHAVCVHLGLGERERAHQLTQLRALLEPIPAEFPLCVAGDFNDWRLRCHRRLVTGLGLSEAFAGATGLPARSFPIRLPMIRLDRVYLRNLRVLKRSVLAAPPWIGLSDHAGLLIEVSP